MKRTSRFQILLNEVLCSVSPSTTSTNRHLIHHPKLVSNLTHLWLFKGASRSGRGIRMEGTRNSMAAAKSTCPYQIPPWLQEGLLTSSSQKSKKSSERQPILKSWGYKARCESLCPPWASAGMQETSRFWKHPVPFPTQDHFIITLCLVAQFYFHCYTLMVFCYKGVFSHILTFHKCQLSAPKLKPSRNHHPYREEK